MPEEVMFIIFKNRKCVVASTSTGIVELVPDNMTVPSDLPPKKHICAHKPAPNTRLRSIGSPPHSLHQISSRPSTPLEIPGNQKIGPVLLRLPRVQRLENIDSDKLLSTCVLPQFPLA
ncbi:hypothetical protein BJ508DRAFT_301551 [Ascobolus immersus RN42]|uniref:Uncharacterized protein n=1 Tax=Ascobolus immersus RN42 TaxID=1160509 RepID=A0A3N4IPS6_ASCIM|nr:hypothetical protein BJ508DRAFT_301551 [Ascobolus immersus RN42]